MKRKIRNLEFIPGILENRLKRSLTMRSTQFSEDMEDDINDYREPPTEFRMPEKVEGEPEEDVDLDEIFEEDEDFDSLGIEDEEDEGDSA